MRDQDDLAALIDRVVAGAGIPGRAAREALRRELWTHFEDAAASSDELRDAIRRFGADAPVAGMLRQVYRRERAAWQVARIAASVVACFGLSLAIELLANLRIQPRSESWQLAPGFWRAAGMSAAVVFGLIVVWEAARPPLNRFRAAAAAFVYAAGCVLAWMLSAAGLGALCVAAVLVGIAYRCARVERWPSRHLIVVTAFAATLYLEHRLLGVAFGPARALMAGAVLGAICSSTIAILHRVDRAFDGRFDPPRLETI